MSWSGDSTNLALGIALILALTFAALVMLREARLETPALLIINSLAMSAVPSILGLNNNRYYVTLSVLVIIAILITLTTGDAKTQKIVAAVLAGALFVLWMPSFPATEFRATPEPRWNYMLDEARARCIAEPERVDVVLRFTPLWPHDETPLVPLNQPLIPC